jgi:CMP/dCMP kinase
MTVNIAIDGPAGAGKSTIAKRVAKFKNFIYVDTGAMYRAIALYFLRMHIKEDDFNGMIGACKEALITIEYQNDEQIVLLNGENVNSLIRTEDVGKMASVCSSVKEVREHLLELQRHLAREKNVVMDGRDIGTFVLPNANTKIYLTASSYVRAKRRHEELLQKGIPCNFNQIEKDIIDRDYRDMNRAIAPLSQAKDAVYIDSSNLTIEEVVNKILEFC